MAACALLSRCSAFTQTADAAQRLGVLAAATSLERDGMPPWRLQVSFTLNSMDGKMQDSGTADVHWTAKDRESVEISSTILHGELPTEDAAFAAGTMREVYLLHELLNQIIRPVPSFQGETDLKIHEQKRTFGKVELNCLTVTRGTAEAKASTPPGNEFCTEPSDPNLLRIHLEPSVTMVRNKPARFQNTSLALDNAISYFGHVAITGHTISLESASASALDPAAPQPSSSSSFEPVPSIVLAGRKIKGAVPEYPITARQNHLSGSVVLAAVIDKTGHVKDLTPIFSPDAALTQSAMAAVKTWTYTPYVVQGIAADVSTTITVNYNLY